MKGGMMKFFRRQKKQREKWPKYARINYAWFDKSLLTGTGAQMFKLDLVHFDLSPESLIMSDGSN